MIQATIRNVPGCVCMDSPVAASHRPSNLVCPFRHSLSEALTVNSFPWVSWASFPAFTSIFQSSLSARCYVMCWGQSQSCRRWKRNGALVIHSLCLLALSTETNQPNPVFITQPDLQEPGHLAMHTAHLSQQCGNSFPRCFVFNF